MNSLRQAVDEYLTMRRNLGFKLRDSGSLLPQFVTFMEMHDATYITQPLALSWAQEPVNVQPSTWATRLSCVRVFARFRHSIDSRTQVPSPGLLPFKTKRARPYLYTDDEINSLLEQALSLPQLYQRCALMPWVYYCVFGLLSVTGLRLGEVCHLRVSDVDLDAALLTIRNAKFGKTRLIPLHGTTCQVLENYIDRRQQYCADRTVSDYLFITSTGNRIDDSQIRRTFYKLSRQIGLRGATDSHGPRLHDFRHRFATNTLLNWYRDDKDPERLLPILSAYLGHVHVADTQWYLENSPELMSEAMRRLERRWEVSS